MTNVNANAPSSLKSGESQPPDHIGKLRIDFYESGIGDTIIITFPSGGIGIVDAHPSQHKQRPNICDIVKGKAIHFVCLTHPHADHGRDLIPILENNPRIGAFWHTIYDVPAFIYGIEQTATFPSQVKEFANKMNTDWGEFFCDILGAVVEQDIPHHLLRSDLREEIIDGVEIHCIGPDESVQNAFFNAYKKKLKDPSQKFPDPNLLSAILVLKFGEGVVLLGADALRNNWESAAKHYRNRNLPKALVLKVPHHGAKNAYNFNRKVRNYIDLCSRDPKAKSVLFAGDAKHPNLDVYDKINSHTEVFCLANGTRSLLGSTNPLQLQIPGARSVRSSPVCNPVISFELNTNGEVDVLAGSNCQNCSLYS